jgi:hypothetical protein
VVGFVFDAQEEKAVKDKNGWEIFEQAMVMLEDVPGETMLERIGRLKDWYLQMQITIGQLQAENEELKKRDFIISSNRNSFM